MNLWLWISFLPVGPFPSCIKFFFLPESPSFRCPLSSGTTHYPEGPSLFLWCPCFIHSPTLFSLWPFTIRYALPLFSSVCLIFNLVHPLFLPVLFTMGCPFSKVSPSPCAPGAYHLPEYICKWRAGEIQYKCMVPIYVFPEMKLRGLVISKKEL